MSLNKTNAVLATALTIALTAGATGAFAWGGGDRQPDPAERFSYIFNELNLTEAQSTEVLDVMRSFADDQRTAMRARRDSGAGRPSSEEMASLRAAAQTALADQLGTVLTADQVADLMTYLEFHGPMMRGGGRHGDRHPNGGFGQPIPPTDDAE